MHTEHTAIDNIDDHAAVAFHPPLLLLCALLVGFGLRFIAALEYLPKSLALSLGPAVVAVALAVFVWAVVTMRRGGASVPTNLPTARIVTHGPYRWSRNPIYLSMVTLTVGVSAWSNSLWFLALAAAMVFLLNWGVISREEIYLERKFGRAYVDYKHAVRRWL